MEFGCRDQAAQSHLIDLRQLRCERSRHTKRG